jgi:hypothetical protein
MAIFKFIAKKMKTGDPVKVEVFLGGESRGFTPGTQNGYLSFETTQSGKYEWYAKRYGEKIASGTSSGGNILIGVE